MRRLTLLLLFAFLFPCTATAQSPELIWRMELAPGQTHLVATPPGVAGHVLSGGIRWTGGCIVEPRNPFGCTALTVTFRDATDVAQKEFAIWLAGGESEGNPLPVGVVAHAAGVIKIEITASPVATPGAFELRLRWRTPADRFDNASEAPKEQHRSERIARLKADLAAGRPDAEETFWAEVKKLGTPLIEPPPDSGDSVLATFAWEARYDTRNVLLRWPPTYSRPDDYYLAHVPGTRVWFKTVRAWNGTRVAYDLAPNYRSEDAEFVGTRDPLNPHLAFNDSTAWSLFELPGALRDEWSVQQPRVAGTLVASSFTSKLVSWPGNMWIYTPPGYEASSGHEYPLVILLPSLAYREGFRAPRILDNLIAASRIRPPIVCFLDVPQILRIDREAAAKAMATELLPQLRAKYRIGRRADDVTIGGFSGGAWWAAFVALQHPESFGNVLSQAGAFQLNWTPQDPNVLARLFADAPRRAIRFHLSVGLYENVRGGDLPVHEMGLSLSLLPSNRHLRDVLRAKGYEVIYLEMASSHDSMQTRVTLAQGLMALLPLRHDGQPVGK